MPPQRTVTSVHNDWLTLVEPVGAFLTIPVLKRVFPNGIPPVDRDTRADVRQRLEDLGSDVAARTTWLQFLLRDLLGHGARLREAASLPGTLRHTVAERHTILRPDFAVIEPQEGGADRVRMIGVRWPLRTALDRRPSTDERGQPSDWAATPIERAAILCRAVNVPLALVTDTDRFALVWAPRSGPSGYAVWTSSLFADERLLLDSFVALLGAQRFFGVSETETLEALLTESGAAQAEVTDRLGTQVRQAVELLVGAFSRANRAAGGKLLASVAPNTVYNAAVTVMMRLVVLLAAEERRLLPADDPLYSASYSVLTIRDELERAAMRDGVETLEKRHTAWHRLLATFRAVHGGIDHDRLRLPAYGGSLFDPARFRFLDSPPIPVDDRIMLAVLDALQVLSFRQGGVTEARRLSYLNLDVEQIGHVYEGLLDHGCARVDDVVLGLIGKKGEEPEIPLRDLERELAGGEDRFAEWIAERGGPQAARVKRLLYEELDADREHYLMAACDNDAAACARLKPFAGLLREDLRELPAVFMPGSLYVTQTSLRRDSGTAYTTKELADEVVRHALEPLVYSPGPAERPKPEEWKLKSSVEILRLKVCDPAVGSGAILVAACRYFADRLVEAWQAEAAAGSTPAILEGVPPGEWTLMARRAVTDHCLYGVDRNPMALEMAKLSLWLTTMAKERPFTFLDHQVRVGDSLLGITSLDQIRWFHVDPERGKALWAERPLFDPTPAIEARVAAALEKARELGAIDVVTLGDVERKARLHAAAVAALEPLSVLADAVVGAALAAAGGEDAAEDDEDEEPGQCRRRGPRRGGWEARTDRLVESLADEVEQAFDGSQPADRRDRVLRSVQDKAAFWLDGGRPALALDRRCLHWPLAFPEVFLAPGRSGFDAIVGNPPYLGGTRISGRFGKDYRQFIANTIAFRTTDRADLVAFFFLRAFALIQSHSSVGFVAKNIIAQGDTRDVGLGELLRRGATIVRAISSEPWPGTTAVHISKVWLWSGRWHGEAILDSVPVPSISSWLTAGVGARAAFQLQALKSIAAEGVRVIGPGFLLGTDEAQSLLDSHSGNKGVVRPYLSAEDFTSRFDQSPTRWAIDFQDWPLDRSAKGAWSDASEAQRATWRREGSVPIDYPEPVAADYAQCLAIVEARVKPERQRRRSDGSYELRYPMPQRWWIYGDRRLAFYSSIKHLDRVIVTPKVSTYHVFGFAATSWIISNRLVMFASDSWSWFSILQSAIHECWAHRPGATTHETRGTYFVDACIRTFPLPEVFGSDLLVVSDRLETIGREFHSHRCALAMAEAQGLTEIYHRFHNQSEKRLEFKNCGKCMRSSIEPCWSLMPGRTSIWTTASSKQSRVLVSRSAPRRSKDSLSDSWS
jgi:hypothetical protein